MARSPQCELSYVVSNKNFHYPGQNSLLHPGENQSMSQSPVGTHPNTKLQKDKVFYKQIFHEYGLAVLLDTPVLLDRLSSTKLVIVSD